MLTHLYRLKTLLFVYLSLPQPYLSLLHILVLYCSSLQPSITTCRPNMSKNDYNVLKVKMEAQKQKK